ncbi:RagB/SusD family nutrient uptake outer membrane protein [Flagellimonas zhangzhouensis]|uniref:SusD family protein n=1 Tax=Flagellimonas zhangzhouensis TaxID=1073328 RepID=A0A1H2VP69_9FLAO|nr:RagB/SusD family nutrient uptake outer membrane protein [Allomuricauda zhangzhouensis]SDQ06526.1 RagB/SusD domain-containing protein [Allomuricauda zhangzhouensis]SDW70162.1 SusD family protein [Allomuricauda zhangzhouensis]
MKTTIKKINRGLLLLATILIGACTADSLEPTLSQNKAVEGSVTKVDNLYSILKGAHNSLTSSGYYGRDMIATNEVRSDNCFSNGNSGRFTTQGEYAYNSNTGFIWDNAYYVIANANIIINTDVTTLEGDQAYGEHLQGAALILRALAHYDLLRVYGQQHAGGTLGVPIVTEFKGEDLFPSRSSVDEVKAAIYNDLQTAFDMMDESYDTSKTIVSKYVAKALEARVAIYFGEWNRAISASESVINSGMYSIISAESYVSSWAGDGGSNVLFELAFSGADNQGSNALSYIYRYPADEPGGYGDLQVVSTVIDLFDLGDVRANILGYQHGGTRLRNMGKYPDTATGADNIPLFRYEEVILNYAEALLETGGDALTQINLITSNRGALAYAAVNKEDILNERRKELMFEGFRFDDLVRTGQAIPFWGSTENSLGTISYPNNLFAYPIPISEINANSNMVQNAGY